VTFRYELRLDDGSYAGTFVTAVSNWQVGDTFTTGDGRDLRITQIVPVELIEVSSERPAFALWEVEPAVAAAGGGEARAR
jgi:hypothetical protein